MTTLWLQNLSQPYHDVTGSLAVHLQRQVVIVVERNIKNMCLLCSLPVWCQFDTMAP